MEQAISRGSESERRRIFARDDAFVVTRAGRFEAPLNTAAAQHRRQTKMWNEFYSSSGAGMWSNVTVTALLQQ